MNVKIIKVTERDKQIWLDLAKEMESIFEGSMVDNPDFNKYIEAKVKNEQALKAVDGNNNTMGIISFSRKNNRITWFGVFERYRNKGAGSRLLEEVLKQLDHSKDIEVITFQADYPPGQAARHLYDKFGFKYLKDIMEVQDGKNVPRSILIIGRDNQEV